MNNIYSTIAWAFEQNYHSDKSNACIHTSEVRFSPLTFRLAEILTGYAGPEGDSLYVKEVMSHKNKYQEDKGRIAE